MASDPRGDLSELESRVCRLQYAAGRVEACRGPPCPFWEEGGAVLPADCLLERLGLDLEGNPDLVQTLLKVRRRLAQGNADRRQARALFYRLVPSARDEDS